MSDERIKTYIGDLDKMMEGGVPAGSVVLMSGMPGTMKSTLTYNILYYNALERGIPGLYITLEQSRESLIKHLRGLGMNHDLVEDKVGIVDMAYLRKSADDIDEKTKWLDMFKMYAENMKKKMGYKILVADSIAALEILADIKQTRIEMFHFFEWLRDLGVTTFLITESYSDSTEVHDEEFLADGVILLRKERKGDDMIRYICIDKMRATNHNTSFYTLLFDGSRFVLTKSISTNF